MYIMFVCPKAQEDGYGSQFQNIISAIVYAELNNLEYVHRPIKNMEHNYDNDPYFVKRLNEHMNIDTKYRIIDKVNTNEKEIKSKITFKQYFDKNFEKYYNSKSLKNIRKNYLANKKPKSHYFKKGIVHITVHLRRHNSHDSRGVPIFDDKYLNIMKQINEKYTKLNVKHQFHIESQGKIEDFKHFSDVFTNITFHLNDLPEVAFHRMVISDILMTNASSYSYTAALLSKGLIFYKKFWHTGAEKWKHF